MTYLLLKEDDALPLAKVSVNENERLDIEFLSPKYNAEIKGLIAGMTEAGVSFTPEKTTSESADHHATNMVAHFMGDPEYLFGVAEDFRIGNPILIDGHEITAHVIEE